jgi:ferrous iron transport protein B
MKDAAQNTSVTKNVTVSICGNPNCGKTTVFNAITGLHQKVGNYPGVTVEKISGQFRVAGHEDKSFTLIDVPGSYSLSAFSPDEYIAARALFGTLKGENPPDVIICLIDSTNLERGLYLLFQVLQIGRPVVVGLNMIDLTQRRGLHINFMKLSQLLGGVPVIPMVGSKGKGVARLKDAVARMVDTPSLPADNLNHPLTENVLSALMVAGNDHRRSKAEYMRILFDVNGPAERDFLTGRSGDRESVLRQKRTELVDFFGSLTAAETLNYTSRASQICNQVVRQARPPAKLISDKVDKVLLHNVFGPIFLVVLMTLMFQSIFSWAEPLMNLIDSAFGSIAASVEQQMAQGPLRSLITDGIIGGVGSVLVFLPQIMILFLYIALLEDSGYMPRAAFIVDRAFRWCGLSGKSFIPMLSSFACAVPGIMATRTIEDRRLRIITIMVAPLMTCSARLPVYTILIAAFIPHKMYLGIFNSQGLVLACLYLLGIVVAVLVSFVLKKAMFRSEPGTFMMEMPSYKLPAPRSVLIRVLGRAKSFVIRAGTVIFAITVLIWALSFYPRSSEIAADYEAKRMELREQFSRDRAALRSEIDAVVAGYPESGQNVLSAIDERPAADAGEEELSELASGLVAEGRLPEELLPLLADYAKLEASSADSLRSIDNLEAGANLRNSYFARMGRIIAPAFRPLGWDWKITMATLAAFPAREVIIATLGTIYNLGGEADAESASLVDRMRGAKWEDGPMTGRNVFTPAVALSIMVFFALCCQCGATIVTVKQETGAWIYSVMLFGYMTALAYVGALATYRLGTWIGF